MAKSTRTKEEQRSYTMSRIGSKNTGIEVMFRKALWREGIRYRKNYKKLPGKPDIAITKHRLAVFCDGEFWHGKDWGAKRDKFQSNKEFWVAKIERNMKRDYETDKQLQGLGWTVMRFWGGDIERDIAACVEDVKAAIFQTVIDSWEGPDDEVDGAYGAMYDVVDGDADGGREAMYGKVESDYGVLAVAEPHGEFKRKP
jgi:DNA mismatch endonuclease (patch repair protein)